MFAAISAAEYSCAESVKEQEMHKAMNNSLIVYGIVYKELNKNNMPLKGLKMEKPPR